MSWHIFAQFIALKCSNQIYFIYPVQWEQIIQMIQLLVAAHSNYDGGALAFHLKPFFAYTMAGIKSDMRQAAWLLAYRIVLFRFSLIIIALKLLSPLNVLVILVCRRHKPAQMFQIHYTKNLLLRNASTFK